MKRLMSMLLLGILLARLCILPVLATSEWQVIWKWEGIIKEVPGEQQGYFITAFEDWPEGPLKREIHVEYLDGEKADGRGGKIEFVLIDFPKGGGWAGWTDSAYLYCPATYHAESEIFVGEHIPDGAGIVWDGRDNENHNVRPLHAKVKLRLLKPKFHYSYLPLVTNATP